MKNHWDETWWMSFERIHQNMAAARHVSYWISNWPRFSFQMDFECLEIGFYHVHTCYRPTFHLHTSIQFLSIHFFVSWSIFNCSAFVISLNRMNALFMTFDLKWRHSWIIVQKPVSIDYIPSIDFVHSQRNAIRFDRSQIEKLFSILLNPFNCNATCTLQL